MALVNSVYTHIPCRLAAMAGEGGGGGQCGFGNLLNVGQMAAETKPSCRHS